MRSLLAALAILLAGCAYTAQPPSCGALGPESGEFRPVRVDFLNDGDLAGRLCVTLNEEGPFDALLKRAAFVPNTDHVASAGIGGDRLHVAAWMAGSAGVHRADFAWSPENFVVIVTRSDGSLRIDHFAQRPAFG